MSCGRDYLAGCLRVNLSQLASKALELIRYVSFRRERCLEQSDSGLESTAAVFFPVTRPTVGPLE